MFDDYVDCPGGAFYIATAPGDVTFQQIDNQKFTDKSVFGELTWHFMPGGQLTVGGRHFSQEFTDAQSYDDYLFRPTCRQRRMKSPASKTVWKIDPSFEYAKDQFVYALWSQGFRRGGANSVPLAGPFAESPLISTYQPDTTNNYEAGLKGRFSNGFSYTVAVFDIKWDKPQISSSLPSGNLAVYNANTAESRGFELESSGPLFVPHLAYSVACLCRCAFDQRLFAACEQWPPDRYHRPRPYTWNFRRTDARESKTSASAGVVYDMNVSPGYDLALAANGVYRGVVPMQLSPTLGVTNRAAIIELRDHESLGSTDSQALAHGPVRDQPVRQAEYSGPADAVQRARQADERLLVNPPREIGVRLAYTF